MASRVFLRTASSASVRTPLLTRPSTAILAAAHAAAPSTRIAMPCAQHAVAMTHARRFASDAASAGDAAKPTESAASGADAAAAAPVDPRVAELTEEVKKKDAQVKELQDKYQRALAEAQNTLTRSQKQLADAKQYAVQSFAKSLLEVADILEIATKAAEEQATKATDPHFKNLFEGVTMTQKVLLQTFERNGLKKFEPLGEKFDPYFQEGLLTMEDPTKTPGTVGIVLKSGYKLHDRCLRAAQVGTVKAPAKPAADAQ